MSTHRQVVLFLLFTLFVEDLDNRVLGLILRLDDHLLTETGLLIELVTVGNVFDDIFEGNFTIVFRNDNGVVWIPFADQVALLDDIAVVHIKGRTVLQVVGIENDIGVDIDDTHLGETADNHLDLFACIVLALNRTQIVDFEATFVA